MGQGRPDGERTDEDPDRGPPPHPEPAGDELHPDRVDGRDPGAGQEPERQGAQGVGRQPRESQVRRAGRDRTPEEEPVASDDVGGAGDRQGERADREADLDGHHEHRELEAFRSPLDAEQRGEGRGREPRGLGEEDPD